MNSGDIALIAVVAGFVVNLLAIGIAVYKLGLAMGKFESIGKQQAAEIAELKDAVRNAGDLITKLAVQTQRQDMFSERLNRMEKIVDDLRRGEGYILPIAPRPAE